MTLAVRNAKPGDVAAMVSLCAAAFPTSARWASPRAGTRWWAGCLRGDCAETWVALDTEAIVGVLALVHDETGWARGRGQRRVTLADLLWSAPAQARAIIRRLSAGVGARSQNESSSPDRGAQPAETARAGRRLWLELIAVHPSAQGRGVGGALLSHAMERARSLGRDAVTLQVRAANTRAGAVYEKHGFAPVRRSRHDLTYSRRVSA